MQVYREFSVGIVNKCGGEISSAFIYHNGGYTTVVGAGSARERVPAGGVVQLYISRREAAARRNHQDDDGLEGAAAPAAAAET